MEADKLNEVLFNMTNISKQPLEPQAEKKLLSQFAKLFAHQNETTAVLLLDDILTPAEKTMLIKRVAIILLIAKDVSNYKIAKTIKVSEATVRNLRHGYKDKEFNVLLKTIDSPSFDTDTFWQQLDVLLRLGMPPMGRGRWSFLDE